MIQNFVIRNKLKGEANMEESVYKVITIIGSSPESWEKAAASAIATAAKSLEDLRIAEVEEMDMQLEEGKVLAYRTKLRVSFRYHETKEK
jgi:flavin-binding protein dodecin